MLFKIVKKTGESRYSLDQYGIEYFLSLVEMMDYDEYIEALHSKDREQKYEMQQKWQAMTNKK